MKLKLETTKRVLKEFADVYGLPKHIDSDEKLNNVVKIMHRELSLLYTEETFKDATSIAWQQSRKFPCITDFHRGWEAPSFEEVDLSDCGIGGSE